MGVADNKSYKNMYHFTNEELFGNHPEKLPSVNVDPKINTTIKKNDERSNVNIEKGEVVLKPDLTGLFKAMGKKHSGGGIDVLLKPDSFIFSDDKGLAFDNKDFELLELKEGGKLLKNNTPARVLRKNIDIEHYNRLVTNLNDAYKDDLAKKSSAMMLEKYIETLGNIAYGQEKKKGMPTGLPDFSVGSAPVYDSHLKDNIDESKQFAKYGGPVLPKAQMGMSNFQPLDTTRQAKMRRRGLPATGQSSVPEWGLWPGDIQPIFQNKYGVTNAANKFDTLKNWDEVVNQLGYPSDAPRNNKAFQQWLYNSSPENKAIIDKWHNTYGDPRIDVPAGQKNRFDNKIGIRWASAINDIMNRPTKLAPPGQQPDPALPPCPCGTDITGACIPCDTEVGTPTPVDNKPQVPNLEYKPQGVKTANWQFTPWQKISQGYNAAKYASIERLMPYRSRANPSYITPSLVNPEQAISDLKGAANAQTQSLDSLNPIMRNAQASSIYGELLNQMPGVRSQYDNQNSEILNRTRLANNQINNNTRFMNMQNDQNYYREAQIGRQNYKNMKTFAADQWMNNVLGDVQTNQSLAYNLLTRNNPAYGYDFKTGNFYRNNNQILDVTGNNSQDQWASMMTEVQKMKQMGLGDSVISALVRGKFFQQAAPYFADPEPRVYRKGGRYRGRRK